MSRRNLRPEDVIRLSEKAMKYINMAWSIYDRILDSKNAGWYCASETGDEEEVLQQALDVFGRVWANAGDEEGLRLWKEKEEKHERR